MNDWNLSPDHVELREEAQDERNTATVHAIVDACGVDAISADALWADCAEYREGMVGDHYATILPILHPYIVEYTGTVSPWLAFADVAEGAAEILDQLAE